MRMTVRTTGNDAENCSAASRGRNIPRTTSNYADYLSGDTLITMLFTFMQPYDSAVIVPKKSNCNVFFTHVSSVNSVVSLIFSRSYVSQRFQTGVMIGCNS